MPSTYRTPGVYVEEVSIFPPSVAAVETAVPAFIGYVAKAEKRGQSLINPIIKVTQVDSLPEFVEYFGGAPDREIEVFLDTNNTVIGVDSSTDYYLYDCIRMFFLNGGRKCYIVPVGIYQSSGTPVLTALQNGLTALRKVDEPTLIVCPDAVSISGSGLYDFNVSAMAQCAELKDRFTICDLQNVNGNDHDVVVQNFRDNIGINNLKYGAAYTPWLKVSLERDLHFRDITFKRNNTSGDEIFLRNLTTDYEIRLLLKDLIDGSGSAIKSVNALNTNVFSSPLQDQFTALEDTLNNAIDALTPTPASVDTFVLAGGPLRLLYNQLRTILFQIFEVRTNLPIQAALGVNPNLTANETRNFSLRKDIDRIIVENKLAVHFQTLIFNSNAFPVTGTADIFIPASQLPTIISNLTAITPNVTVTASGTGTITYPTPSAGPTFANAGAIVTQARDAFLAVLPNFITAANSLLAAAKEYESTFENSLKDIFGFYKSTLNEITDRLNELPPSASIAGVYATVDANRGVWKAPANVSLNSVNGIAHLIEKREHDVLNIDANAGKSINAIRPFTGKGILVWGARTLAGNDNEWRYISVRRFFNMVEESTKKATEQFVFEPNDANTWVRVKAMIENFLTLQWRAGALAGAKPEQAFFVKVGLGETMTALDILEGRMIIEIGMAVVRPAEFIILRFSHKMQES